MDHFIPWARYPVDLGHNFVLAHVECNRDKSDTLAAVVHLKRWCLRNQKEGAKLASAFDREGILHDLKSSRHVALWAYSQAEAAGSGLWIARGADPVVLDPAWRSADDARSFEAGLTP